jgi:hypothetical protein
VLAKEQAEQEQLARQHHRQQYPQHSGMPACGYSNTYALQQPAYMVQQQQQAMGMHMGMQPQQAMGMHMGMQPQQAMNLNIGFVVPAGMDSSSMDLHAWQQGAGAMHMNMQPAPVVAGNMPAGVPVVATNVMPYQAHMQQQQQQHVQQQVWCPAGSMQPTMQQVHPGHALAGSAQGMQDSHMLAAHPASVAAAGGAMQTMVAASPMAASTPMLVHSPLQQQQHQGAGVVQQYVLQGGVPSNPINPMQMCAVSTAAAPTSLAPAGLPQDVVLQHVHSMPAHVGHMSVQGSGEVSSPGACGHVGGPTFVQDMLTSLNYAAGTAAGQAGMAASAGLQVQHQQQQQGMMGAPWVLPANVAATSSVSVGQSMLRSWSEVPAASMGGMQQQQGFPVGSAMLANSSPAFSAASSTSAATSTAYALLGGVSSACV